MPRQTRKICPKQECQRPVYLWLKKRLKMRQKDVFVHIGVSQPNLSLWEKGIQNLGDEPFQKLLELLINWRAKLPVDGWVPGREPYLFQDFEGEEKTPVIYNVDFRDESEIGKIYRYNLQVMCNHHCHRCSRLTPSDGVFCMHCGKKRAGGRLPDMSKDDKFRWPKN